MPLSNPCEECPESTVSLIPDSSTHDTRLNCPVSSCDACESVAKMEAEILRAQERVSKLKRNLISLKSDVNKRHDPFSRLPAELVSEIFKSHCSPPKTFRRTNRNRAPLVVGGVCRRWREITLVTPQLWAEVRIRAHINKPYDLAVATEWLSRSRSLPLTLDIKFDTNYSAEPPEDNSFLPLIRLLRSHSIRWRNMSIDAFWESSIIPPLFANLETLPSNFGNLYLDTVRHAIGWKSNTLLSPRTLEASEGSSTIGFPLGWDRLTSLSSVSMEALYLDELLNIIKNAPMLTQCTITSSTIPLDSDQFAFNFQDLPIINHSITSLEIQGARDASENLLGYLTLPSLATLRYYYECHSAEDTDLVILKGFLDRSSPPLNEFHLTIRPDESNYVDIWRHKDFPVTSLAFDAPDFWTGDHDFEDKIKSTNDFMALLSTTLDDGGLPKLRRLKFTPAIIPRFWSNLCYIIQKFLQISSSDSVPDGPVCAESHPISRGLLSVFINLEASPVSMDATVYSRLIEFGYSGVTITVREDICAMPRPFHQLHVDTLPPKI